MALPDYQSIMFPLLELAGDGEEQALRASFDVLADRFRLTEEERRELLPSGRQPAFENRVGWARTYLKKAGLLETPRRGYFSITDRGRQVLMERPPELNTAYLERFSEFQEFRRRDYGSSDTEAAVAQSEQATTPEEALERAYQRLRTELASELLQVIKAQTPAFFERLVVDVLVKMGYGGSRKEAGQALGRSGDAGIDGIIKEDRLGLDIIYIQAKKWDGNSIGRPEIQKFAGALQGQRAKKGIFITTSTFTSEAREYTRMIDSKIILMDGEELAGYMIDFGVGITSVASYELKKVDQDYFSGEQ